MMVSIRATPSHCEAQLWSTGFVLKSIDASVQGTGWSLRGSGVTAEEPFQNEELVMVENRWRYITTVVWDTINMKKHGQHISTSCLCARVKWIDVLFKHKYSINQTWSHSGGSACGLAALYTVLMVTIGKRGGERTGCQRGLQCRASTVPPYRRDEVAPSIFLAPSKEEAYLAAELMTDGSRRELFSPKGWDPWLSDLQTELWVSEGWQQHKSWEYRYTGRMMSSSMVCLRFFLNRGFLNARLLLLSFRMTHNK